MLDFALNHKKHTVVFGITPNSFITKRLESVLLHLLCFMDRFLLDYSPLFSCYGSGCSDLICHCCGDACCSTFTFHGNLYAVAFITHQSLFLVNKQCLFFFCKLTSTFINNSNIYSCFIDLACYLSQTFNIILG